MKQAIQAHQKGLDYFEGTWHTTGQLLSGEHDGQAIEGLDTYEWLPGNHYLMHTADVLIGDKRMHLVEMIGYDQQARMVLGRSFDNEGNYGEMGFDLRGDEILINGPEMRFNGRFNDDFSRISGIWETASAQGWHAVMEINLTKK